MAGEVQRSGLSNPETVNLTNQLTPAPPSEFQVVEVGNQSTGVPDELAYIIFQFKAPLNYLVTVADGAGDDVYDSGESVGSLSGTASTNDEVLNLSAPPTEDVAPGDRLLVGTDPTRYVVESVDGSDIYLTYGLLQDQTAPGATVYLLTKEAESPDTSRLITCDADDGDEITITGAYSFDYRLSWTLTVELLELEDLDKVGGTLENSNLNYYAQRTANICQSGLAQNATVIPCLGAVVDLAPGDTISIGSKEENFSDTYTILTVSSESINLTSGLTRAIGAEYFIYKHLETSTFASYSGIDGDTFDGFKAIGNDIGGYRLYADDNPTSDLSPGTKVMDVTSSDLSLTNDGYYKFTFDTPDHTWDSVKKWFSLTAIDLNVPANESTPDTSPWAITPPGQASITNGSLVGTDLTVTYENITDGGLNPRFYKSMGGITMQQYSEFGGYDIYLIDYTATTGTYSKVDDSTGSFISSDLLVGDVVRLVNSALQRVWVAHCVTNGSVQITDSQLTYGDPLPDYNTPNTSQFVVSFLRVTDRDSQSVLPLDGEGNKQYLTDLQDEYTLEVTANTDQGVLIESIDTEAGYGTDEL